MQTNGGRGPSARAARKSNNGNFDGGLAVGDAGEPEIRPISKLSDIDPTVPDRNRWFEPASPEDQDCPSSEKLGQMAA